MSTYVSTEATLVFMAEMAVIASVAGSSSSAKVKVTFQCGRIRSANSGVEATSSPRPIGEIP